MLTHVVKTTFPITSFTCKIDDLPRVGVKPTDLCVWRIFGFKLGGLDKARIGCCVRTREQASHFQNHVDKALNVRIHRNAWLPCYGCLREILDDGLVVLLGLLPLQQCLFIGIGDRSDHSDQLGTLQPHQRTRWCLVRIVGSKSRFFVLHLLKPGGKLGLLLHVGERVVRVVEALAEVAGALLTAPVDLLLLLLIFSTLSERIKDVEDGYFCSVRILKCYNLFDTRTDTCFCPPKVSLSFSQD